MCSIGSLIAILTSKGVQALVNHPLAASARSDRSIMVRSSHEGERDVGRADVARGDYPSGVEKCPSRRIRHRSNNRGERKSVVSGKSGSVRVDLGGGRNIKKKK